MARSEDFSGHQRGHQLAITGDFFVATDKSRCRRIDLHATHTDTKMILKV